MKLAHHWWLLTCWIEYSHRRALSHVYTAETIANSCAKEKTTVDELHDCNLFLVLPWLHDFKHMQHLDLSSAVPRASSGISCHQEHRAACGERQV